MNEKDECWALRILTTRSGGWSKMRTDHVACHVLSKGFRLRARRNAWQYNSISLSADRHASIKTLRRIGHSHPLLRASRHLLTAQVTQTNALTLSWKHLSLFVLKRAQWGINRSRRRGRGQTFLVSTKGLIESQWRSAYHWSPFSFSACFPVPCLPAAFSFLFILSLVALISGKCTACLSGFTSHSMTSPHLTQAHKLSNTISRNANWAHQCVSASHRYAGQLHEEGQNREYVERERRVQVYAPEDYCVEGERE